MLCIALDVHHRRCQACVKGADGRVLHEEIVPTEREALREFVERFAGPRLVVFEEGPLSGFLKDCLGDLAKVESLDPTRNALVSRQEVSNDKLDARRLGTLKQAGATNVVYIPEEPYRTLRTLLVYEERLTADRTALINRTKALCRRQCLRYRRRDVLQEERRGEWLRAMPNAALRQTLESLLRRLDQVRGERLEIRRELKRWAAQIPVIERLQTIPGVGPTTARTLVAWIVDPRRFRSREALNAYSGLGLGQAETNWKAVAPNRASRRGQRAVKRVLFLAAHAATHGQNALAGRYQRRVQEQHWPERKAIRDVARKILFTADGLWRNGGGYRDELTLTR
jgi:transposase